MEKQEDYFSQNEKELMEYFGYSGNSWSLEIKIKISKNLVTS